MLVTSWRRSCVLFLASAVLTTISNLSSSRAADDAIAELQTTAATTNQSDWGYWGPNPEKYSSWTSHSNRLIPVYTFGIDLQAVSGKNSLYRNEAAIRNLYGYLPEKTLNPDAQYFDQTDIYRLQREAVAAGKKRVILFVFDGMDWQTTRNAAIAKLGKVAYQEGRVPRRSRRRSGIS